MTSKRVGVFGGVVRLGCGPGCAGVCEVDVAAATETNAVALAGKCEVCGQAFARGDARRDKDGRMVITVGGAAHAMHVTATVFGVASEDDPHVRSVARVARASVPSHYACAGCKQRGCKLWRSAAASSVGDVELHCADCAIVAVLCDHSGDALGYAVPTSALEIASDGMWTNRRGARSDRIGWLMPALPTEDGKSYYTTVGEASFSAIAWWRGLPTRAPC